LLGRIGGWQSNDALIATIVVPALATADGLLQRDRKPLAFERRFPERR
jgi:hypothetical protein